MPNKNKKFYVTTPIYYVTAKPHLGSLYSTLLADVLARWNILQGKKVFFATGTDEHGQKVAQAAHEAGKDPKEFVDSFIPAYKDVWQLYDISYNHFIRTTDKNHIAGAQQFIKKMLDNGAIYKSRYEGWYCTPCETFVLERDIITPQDLHDEHGPACSSCARTTIAVAEETYFFRLSEYQDKLLKFYSENPDFIVPKARFNEVISFVQSGLKDLSISRTTVKWGVPFPQDPEHTIYVWTEALCNYLTAIGYGQKDKQDEFNFWWPADMHVIGKDIVRFHAVYWPAFLMAADLALPKRILVHGWIKVNHQKMSKSLGNVVDPIELHKHVGAESVRYYLLRQIPINQDGDFSTQDLEQRVASDLANDLGNLLQRMVSLAHKYEVQTVTVPIIWGKRELDLRDEAYNMIEDFEQYMHDCMFHLALGRLWKFINNVNAYFHEQEPWQLAKKDPEQFMQILSATSHSLRTIAILLWPVMPNKMAQLLESIGIKFEPKNNTLEQLELGTWHSTFTLKQIASLFIKPEIKKEVMENKEQKIVQELDYITIDDVIKVEVRVGTIAQCVEIEGSDKLLKMQIDFGDLGNRQILGGVKKWYAPHDLIGKQATFIFNLKPRKMMGHESQGMMLLAEDKDGKMQLVSPAAQVPNGTQLR